IAVSRAKSNCDTRHAPNRLDDADELRRPKCAAENLEARSEIGYPNGAAFVVGQLRNNDRGVAHVVRPGLDVAVQQDVGKTFFIIPRSQPAEHGVAVIARQAPPHIARGRLKKSRRTAIANNREIEAMAIHERTRALAARNCSALRTCDGLSNVPVSPGK